MGMYYLNKNLKGETDKIKNKNKRCWYYMLVNTILGDYIGERKTKNSPDWEGLF